MMVIMLLSKDGSSLQKTQILAKQLESFPQNRRLMKKFGVIDWVIDL